MSNEQQIQPFTILLMELSSSHRNHYSCYAQPQRNINNRAMRLGRVASFVANAATRSGRHSPNFRGSVGVCSQRTIHAFPTANTIPNVSSLKSKTTSITRATSTQTTIRYLSSHSDNKNPDHVPDKDQSAPSPVMHRSQYQQKIPLRMPDMGEGKGKVLKWYKNEGDVILPEDALCDIETPDFVFGLETDDDYPTIMGEIPVKAPSEEVDDDEILCYLLHPSEEGEKGVDKNEEDQKTQEHEGGKEAHK